jgi:plasmid stability protein
MVASLTIRNIPEDAKRRFRKRAAHHGRSMEEEARRILIAAADEEETPATPRKSIFEMLYEASRPGFELPIPRDSPASFAKFDE